MSVAFKSNWNWNQWFITNLRSSTDLQALRVGPHIDKTPLKTVRLTSEQAYMIAPHALSLLKIQQPLRCYHCIGTESLFNGRTYGGGLKLEPQPLFSSPVLGFLKSTLTKWMICNSFRLETHYEDPWRKRLSAGFFSLIAFVNIAKGIFFHHTSLVPSGDIQVSIWGQNLSIAIHLLIIIPLEHWPMVRINQDEGHWVNLSLAVICERSGTDTWYMEIIW